jgi:O-antigen/teichoic acid export membrane protein
MVGQVVATLISAVTIIWMACFLGSTAYGEYTIALFPVSIAMLFQDLGMNLRALGCLEIIIEHRANTSLRIG